MVDDEVAGRRIGETLRRPILGRTAVCAPVGVASGSTACRRPADERPGNNRGDKDRPLKIWTLRTWPSPIN